MSNFSILWSQNDSRKSFSAFSFVKELKLDSLLDLRTNRPIGALEQTLPEFFTVHRDTMLLRCELFQELLHTPALYEELRESFADLGDLCALKREKEGKDSNEALLYSIKELELYVGYLEKMRGIFDKYSVKSAALVSLKDKIEEICTSGEYPRLREEVKKQSHTIQNIKSVTIGVNLNAQMMPIEAGVVKVNETSYVSGNFIDKLLKLDFAESEYTCAAPLLPATRKITDSELAVLRMSLNGALNKIFASSLSSWAGVIRKYVLDGLDDLFPILYEWRFAAVCTDALLRLKNAGMPLCSPSFGKADHVTGIYHPMLALTKNKADVIGNSLDFDFEAGIYILTGPNQGGKSIYTSAVGILYAMLHLGLPLPAEKAELRPVDGIFTHFIDDRESSYRHGRFSGECENLRNISEAVSSQSLFLFDEALSSTGAGEAAVLAREILLAYADIGARGIFTTHLHELCALAEEGCNLKIRNLTAEIEEDSHKRMYRIQKGGSGGQSYAMDIARMYRLTKEDILSMHTK